MVRHGRNVAQNWNRLDLEPCSADRNSTSRDGHKARTQVSASKCHCVFVCASWWTVSRKGLQNTRGFMSPWEEERRMFSWVEGGSVEGLESVKLLAVFSLLRKIHCPHWYCLQQYVHISSAVIDANTPRTNHHLCYMHQNEIRMKG